MIALLGSKSYPGPVTLRTLLSLLIALAVLLAPAGMIGKNAAMAAPAKASMTMSHCAEDEPDRQQQAPEACCIVVCSALPSQPARLARPHILSRPALASLSTPVWTGIEPLADTPPPRQG